MTMFVRRSGLPRLTEEQKAWLRKGVEWCEWQEGLPAIDRQWEQGGWVTLPKVHAVDLVNECIHFREYTTGELHAWREQVENHCGTAYCFAGYLGSQMNEAYVDDELAVVEDGLLIAVGEYVEIELGIRGYPHTLFNGSNSAAMIRTEAERLAGEPL